MARLRKMYRIKLVLVSLCLATFLYAARNRIFPRLPSGSIRLSSSSSSGGALSAQEFLRDVARIHTCPVCFGTDLCQELTRSTVDISRTLHVPDGRLPGVHQVYSRTGLSYWLQPLHSFPLAQHVLRNFEELVCRNGTEMMAGGQQSESLDAPGRRDPDSPCDLSEAAENSFLYSSTVDNPTIRRLYQGHLASRRRIPITACPTFRLVDALVSAFDADSDGTLRASEKSVLLTTLSTWPHLAVHRVLRSQAVRVPHLAVAGACGRVAVAEAAYKPLAAYLDQPPAVRKGLALQVLKMLEYFVDEDPTWVVFTVDVDIGNLVVTNAGQVALLDMSGVMLLDRDLLESDEGLQQRRQSRQNNRRPCDLKCLSSFYEGLMEPGAGEEGEDGARTNARCFRFKDRLELMFALACKNVLSDMDEHRKERDEQDQRGLLHSLSSRTESAELNGLLRSCVDEEQPGDRAKAVLSLVEMMSANFPEEDEEEEDDGNNNHGEEETGDDFKTAFIKAWNDRWNFNHTDDFVDTFSDWTS